MIKNSQSVSAKINDRTVCLGWAYSNDKVPTKPIYVGTKKQIFEAIDASSFKANHSRSTREYWFYQDALITGADNGSYASTDTQAIDIIVKCMGRKKIEVYLGSQPKTQTGRPRILKNPRTVALQVGEDEYKVLASLGKNKSEVIRRLIQEEGSRLKTSN